MENESNNFRPQQSGDEQTIDIKQLIYVCISHWYLFLISVIVALALLLTDIKPMCTKLRVQCLSRINQVLTQQH